MPTRLRLSLAPERDYFGSPLTACQWAYHAKAHRPQEFSNITDESDYDQKFVSKLYWGPSISDYRLVDFQIRVKKLNGK